VHLYQIIHYSMQQVIIWSQFQPFPLRRIPRPLRHRRQIHSLQRISSLPVTCT